MNLETWAAEVHRLYLLVKHNAPPEVFLQLEYAPDEKLRTNRWRARIGQNEFLGLASSPEDAAEQLMRSLRQALKKLIEQRRSSLEQLLTLENEAALKLLEEEGKGT